MPQAELSSCCVCHTGVLLMCDKCARMVIVFSWGHCQSLELLNHPSSFFSLASVPYRLFIGVSVCPQKQWVVYWGICLSVHRKSGLMGIRIFLFVKILQKKKNPIVTFVFKSKKNNYMQLDLIKHIKCFSLKLCFFSAVNRNSKNTIFFSHKI